MPSGSPTLWLPIVDADGSSWPVVSSATLATDGSTERVQLWNRDGDLFAEFVLPADDGQALLSRLGLRASP
jgi:hypothetical protein